MVDPLQIRWLYSNIGERFGDDEKSILESCEEICNSVEQSDVPMIKFCRRDDGLLITLKHIFFRQQNCFCRLGQREE